MTIQSPKDINPELRKAITRVPRLPFAIRSLLPLTRLLYNVGVRTKVCRGVNTHTETHNGVELLVFTPQGKASNAAILWMFGGGHIAGNPRHLNGIASRTARELNVTVFVPNYRLAPRRPFPADLDDCNTAWNWLVSNATDRGINPDKLAIAGHSAGGGIAAALAQKIRDCGGQQPKAQCLFYPMLDDRVAADKTHDSINHYIWNNKANRVAWESYLAHNLVT